MSIIRMKKLAVIGLDTAKETLISELMELGVVQLTDQNHRQEEEKFPEGTGCLDGDEEKTSALDAELSRISLALEALETYSTARSPLFQTRRSMKKEDFAAVLSRKDTVYQEIDKILNLYDEIHRTKENINKKNADLIAVSPWLNYGIPLETGQTGHTIIDLGILPSTADMGEITKKAEAENENIILKEINRDKDLIYVAVIALKEDHEKLLDLLKQHGYVTTVLKGLEGTASENKEKLIADINEMEKQCVQIEVEIAKRYKAKPEIECIHDKVAMDRDKERIKEKILKTERAFHMEGWLPEGCSETVSKVLTAHQCCFAFRDPEPDEIVPVLVSNNSMVYPFEAVTSMYSLPDYRGVDPAKFFALFYAMFFGIMLSDAGYGFVIAIACFIILRKFSLEGMTHRMIKMFFFCGISTIFWGAMFGGWFGDFFQVAAKAIFNKEITINPIWFNPIEDPTKLLIYSLAFGVIHLFLGMGIHAAMLIKRGQWIDVICDVFSWYLVITGGILWLGGGSISQSLVTPGMIITILGAVILLLTGGRNNKGLGKITGGLSSLYSVTSYVSDILSYSRLLALGLATGVIAQVVNTMGSLLGGGIVGTVVLLVVFVVGHTFNLAINALGAFVHSTRLQYIEFFGKFYEDGGEPFEPFSINTKYIRIKSEMDGGNSK